MKLTPTFISGLMLAKSDRFEDERGAFMRLYCRDTLDAAHLRHHAPVQMNYSITRTRGALRGMHYQTGDQPEGKIVRCLHGHILDVIVDLRKGSPTFLQHFGVELNDSNTAVVIPPGCAHGFQLLGDSCELIYTHGATYAPDHQAGVRYDDPRINIAWPLAVTVISDRDKNMPLLDEDFQGVNYAL